LAKSKALGGKERGKGILKVQKIGKKKKHKGGGSKPVIQTPSGKICGQKRWKKEPQVVELHEKLRPSKKQAHKS